MYVSSTHLIYFFWAAVTLGTYKRIVNIMKMYIERNNMHVELIRFHKKYRLYSLLLLRSYDFNATDVFTLGKSLQHKPVR